MEPVIDAFKEEYRYQEILQYIQYLQRWIGWQLQDLQYLQDFSYLQDTCMRCNIGLNLMLRVISILGIVISDQNIMLRGIHV